MARNGKKIKIDSQRIATQFVEDVERTEARGRRESAAVNELTLRLIETQAETQRIARQVSRDPLTGVLNRTAFESAAERAAGARRRHCLCQPQAAGNLRVGRSGDRAA